MPSRKRAPQKSSTMKIWSKSVLLPVFLSYVAYQLCSTSRGLGFYVTTDLLVNRMTTSGLEWCSRLTGMDTVAEQRYLLGQNQEQANKSYELTVKDTHFAGVAVRVYAPSVGAGESDMPLRPGVLYLRGGSWTAGSIELSDSFCHRLAHTSQAVVVAIDYRLAPEFPFPAALDDTVKAVKYFAKHTYKYAVDPSKIVIMGEGAGGNLALSSALQLRDDGLSPGLRAQVLLYPTVQVVNLHTPARETAAQVYGFSRYLWASEICNYLLPSCNPDLISTISKSQHVSPSQRQAWQKSEFNLNDLPAEFLVDFLYPDLTLGDAALWEELGARFTNPLASPLLAESLAKLPETFLLNVNNDQSRDDVYWLKRKLEKDNVRVRYRFMPKGFHGIMQERYLKFVDVAAEAFVEIASFIKML